MNGIRGEQFKNGAYRGEAAILTRGNSV